MQNHKEQTCWTKVLKCLIIIEEENVKASDLIEYQTLTLLKVLMGAEPLSKQTTKVQELAGVQPASPTNKFYTCGDLNPDTQLLTLKPDIFVSY